VLLNILILSQYYPPDMGGGATRAQNMAKGLARNGCNITVIAACPHYPTGNIPQKYRWRPVRIDYEESIRIIRTFVPPLSSKGIFRRLILFFSFVVSSLFPILVLGHFDIVWAANPNIVSVFPSFIYGKIKRCPVVQNIDDLWPEALYDLGLPPNSLLAKSFEALASLAYGLVAAITPISPGYCKVLVQKYHLEKAKLEVIRAGVDTRSFPELQANSRFDKKVTVLYIGSFSQAYDFDQVLQAAGFLADYPAIQIVLQGGGEMISSLKLKLASKNLHNVQIFDKILDRKEVAKALANADILLLPLRNLPFIELGISSKLYEYQAAGKPIICCSSGHPAKYIIDSNSGIVVNPGDSLKLAESIIHLSENPKLANELGMNGKQYVTNELDVAIIGSKMKGFFQKLITHSS
jgi:colanic acid biosynthesis glycosyl transferase WcaI